MAGGRRRAEGMRQPITIEQLFWEDADAGGVNAPAVSREVFDQCTLKIMTETEFAANEQIMHAIAKGISAKGFADVEWQLTGWTQAHLVNQCGFTRADEPTMLAVAVGDEPTVRFAIKYIYLPMEKENASMRLVNAPPHKLRCTATTQFISTPQHTTTSTPTPTTTDYAPSPPCYAATQHPRTVPPSPHRRDGLIQPANQCH